MKTKPVARLAAALAVFSATAVLLASCRQPPFDPALSASEYTAAKLGDPVWSKTVRLWDTAKGGYYLPRRDPGYYAQGTWVKKEAQGISVGFYDTNFPHSFNLSFFVYNAFGDIATLLSPIYPPLTSMDKVMMGANYNSNEGIIKYDGAASPIFNVVINDVVGFGVAPFNSTDDYLALVIWPVASAYPSIACQVFNGNSGLIGAVFNDFTIGPPARPTGPVWAGYYKSSQFLYLSYPLDGDTVTYRWEYDGASSPTLAPVPLPISRQLTGILSDGRLLADTGDYLYVYEADGSGEFSIPTGALRFVHERFDGIKYISVFTRTVEIPQQDSDDSEFLIQIWEIDTLDLKDLAH